MGLITKNIKIRPMGKMIPYYRSLGYSFKKGEEIEIPVDLLTKGSNKIVECSCDYCGSIIQITYKLYIMMIEGIISKVSCPNCRGIKTKESNLKIYGVESISSLPEIKAKKEATCLEKFGKTNYLLTDEFKEYFKQHNIEKYGVEHHFMSEEVIEARNKKVKEKYGVDNISQLEEVKKKKIETCEKNFNVSNPSQSKVVQLKKQKTSEKKYGTKNPQQSESVKEKTRNTNLKKYGSNYFMGTDKFLEMSIRTNLKKYGCRFPVMSDEVKKKIALTFQKNQTVATSRQQKYIYQLYGGELNGVVSHYNCDIVFRDEKIIFEYDGGGHFLGVKLGEETEEEFKRKELIRDKCIKNEGFRIVRIISRKDYLPSDAILLQMLQYARDFFTQNPDRSWLSFDLDNNCIYNAYHKETTKGIPYDYGILCKSN